LAVQSANGTNSATNRTDLQLEVTQLLAQIADIAANTEFNGVNPISGAAGSLSFQVGAEANQTITIDFNGVGGTAAGIGLNAPDISTQAGAQTAIGLADTALQALGTRRATLGALQNRIEFTINTLAIEEENSAA